MTDQPIKCSVCHTASQAFIPDGATEPESVVLSPMRCCGGLRETAKRFHGFLALGNKDRRVTVNL